MSRGLGDVYKRQGINSSILHLEKLNLLEVVHEMTSEHYNQDRDWREYLISTVIGEGNIVDSFVVDKGHRNGPEIHSVTDTGIIIIYNKKSGKMVTKLIARPGQVIRYYKNEGKEIPWEIVKIAKRHQAEFCNQV